MATRYIGALILLQLLSCRVAWARYDIGFLWQSIEYTHQYYNFTNMPIFLADDVHIDERNQLHALINNAQTLSAQYIFDNRADPTIWNLIRNHIQIDALNVVLCATATDPIWTLVDRRLRRLRQTRMIVLMPDELIEMQNRKLKKFELMLKKLWQLQFIQSIVISDQQIYSYTPYPYIQIYKVNLVGNGDLFPAIQTDLMGYNISTPVDNDIPRIFFVTNDKGEVDVKGFGYQILSHFLRRLNVTLHLWNLHQKRSITSSVNTSAITDSIARGDIEITVHPYTGIDHLKGVLSYPIFKVPCCLIAPVRNEIERFMYIVRPFSWSSWVLIIVAIFYTALMLSCLNPALRRIKSIHSRLTRSLLEAISQVLFLPSLMPIYNPNIIYFFTYTLLAVLGFYTTAWYNDLLSSFMTTFLVGKQIDSLEDVLEAKQKILVKTYEKSMILFFVPDNILQQVDDLMVSVNASVQITNLLNFNTTYAYPVTEERWRFLALQQQYANKPIYRFSECCFGEPFVGYPMRLDSHLERYLTQFIMDIQMTGLDHYWLISDFHFALQAGYLRLIENILPFNALDVPGLRVAWFILICGWLFSILIYCFEHIYKWHQKHKQITEHF